MSRMSLILVLTAAFGVGGRARPAGADQGCGESGLFAMDNRPASQGCGESGLFTIDNQSVPGDLDHDADVDAGDFELFEACATRSRVPYNPASLPPGCTFTPTGGHIAPDFNHDGNVGMDDFAIFQRCYSGAGHAADPNCAD